MNAEKFWVTGGAGFLGSRVVSRLLEDGHEVHCLVRSRLAADALVASISSEHASRLKVVPGSLNDSDSCRALVTKGSRGFHIASLLNGSAAALFIANVVATRRLLAAVRDSECPRFVLVSSIAVYGPQNLPSGALLDESCALDPQPQLRDPYTFSKVVQEQVCWDARAEWNLPLVVVRPGNIYGPGREVLSARVGIKVGPVLLRLGGRQQLPYTYVDNCAEAIVRAGYTPGIEGESFNIVDDDLPTGIQLVNKHRRALGSLPTVAIPLWALGPLARGYTAYTRYSRGQLPPILTPHRVAAMWNAVRYTNVKAKTKLDWSCRTTLEQGMDAAFQALKQSATR
jgi:nucleoside-diphosphate-sugar epimerase